jgi:hypothetical protein
VKPYTFVNDANDNYKQAAYFVVNFFALIVIAKYKSTDVEVKKVEEEYRHADAIIIDTSVLAKSLFVVVDCCQCYSKLQNIAS